MEAPDKATKDAYAERGFVHVPATGSHGGVIAKGGVRRVATLSLAALRLLKGDKETLKLRRYILGLALVAFTANASTYLRQGTNLVPDFEKPRTLTLVNSDGTRTEYKLSHADALSYAKAAAKEFVIGQNQEVEFDKELAIKDWKGEGDTKATAKSAAKKAAKAKADATAVSSETPVE